MSAVAPVVAGTFQYAPSQPLLPSHASLNTHPSPMPAFVSSDRPFDPAAAAAAAAQNQVLIEAQAKAQQAFRQRQLLAYQRQQQLQQLHLQKHAPPGVVVQTPPPLSASQESHAHPLITEQLDLANDTMQDSDPQLAAELTNKPSSSTGLARIQTNHTSPVTTTTTTTPNLTPTPGPKPSLKGLKRPGLRKRRSTGHAVLRLLQFAEQLDPGDQALQRTFWDRFISDFFTKSSKTKLGLRNSDTDEQRPFYISHYSVAKFFHTLYESGGVSSIQLTLEQTMEFILPGGHMNVECPRANFIYRYTNGSLVSSTGHLWVRFSLTDKIWKIKHFEFACQRNEEFVSRSHLVLNKGGSKLKKSNKNALPESPINVWGIPPKVFHTLQMMDTAVQLDDIIFYSLIAGTTAKESLAGLAFNMEQQQTQDTGMATHSVLDTPDPPVTPGEADLLPSSSPPSGTTKSTKPNKKQQSTRRKSFKAGKSSKQEKRNPLEEPAQTDNKDSPMIKTEPDYAQQQAYPYSKHLPHQHQQPIGHTTPLPSGATTPAYQQLSSGSLPQPMPYMQTYTGSFVDVQHEGHVMGDFTQSPQTHFRKRSDSINEDKQSPVSRKKGKTTTNSK